MLVLNPPAAQTCRVLLTPSVAISGESRSGGDVGGAVVELAPPLPVAGWQGTWTCGSETTYCWDKLPAPP